MHSPSVVDRPETPGIRTAVHRSRPSLFRNIRMSWKEYLYLSPLFVLLLVFTIYPLFSSLGYTLYQWDGIGEPTVFVGFENFARVMRDEIFWQSFLHTFVYTAVLVPIQLTLALTLALILNNPRLRFATLYRSIFFLPVVTSAAVVGVIVQLIMTNFGNDLNLLLQRLHLTTEHIDWLGDPRFALGIIIVVGIWHTLGVNMVYFLAGLQTIPTDLYEAAQLDGANAFDRFRFVTIPMLRGVGLVVLILAILGSLQVFDIVQVITRGGPYFATEVVNTYIYHQAFGDSSSNVATDPNIGFASAASFFYGIVLLGFSVLQMIIFRRVLGRRSVA